MNFYTVGDSEEPATGSVLSEGGIPIAVAGSLVSEGPTEMMADEVLFSEVHAHVPAGTADSLFSDDHAETADSRFSDLPTGMSDSLVPRVGVYMFSVAQLDACRNPNVCIAIQTADC